MLLDQITTIVGVNFFNCIETNPIPYYLMNAGFHYWLIFDYVVTGAVLMLIIFFGKYLGSSRYYIATFPLILVRFYSGIHNLIIITSALGR